MDLDNEKVMQISCGSNHSIVLTKSNDIFCWGQNNYNQCLQDKRNRTYIDYPKLVTLEMLRNRWIIFVYGAYDSTIIIIEQ